MTAADDDDVRIKMFHVKHPSFADTKSGEYLAKNVLDINFSHQAINSPNRQPKIRSTKLCQIRGSVQPLFRRHYRRNRSFHRLTVPILRRVPDGRNPSRQGLTYTGDQAINTSPRHSRDSKPVGRIIDPSLKHDVSLLQIGRVFFFRLNQMNPDVSAHCPVPASCNPDLFNLIVPLPKAGGIQKRHRKPVNHRLNFDHVSRRARYFRGNRSVPANQKIQKRRLTDVGSSDDRHLKTIANPLRDRNARNFPDQFRTHAPQPLHHLRANIDRHVLIRKIDRCFDQSCRAQKVVAPRFTQGGQSAGKYPNGLNALRLGFSVEQVGKTFGLCKIETPVVHRAPRKFPRLSEPQSRQRRKFGEYPSYHSIAAMKLEFDDDFAGKAAVLCEGEYQGLIEKRAVRSPNRPHAAPVHRQITGQQLSRRMRKRTGYPDNRHTCTTRRSRSGKYGFLIHHVECARVLAVHRIEKVRVRLGLLQF